MYIFVHRMKMFRRLYMTGFTITTVHQVYILSRPGIRMPVQSLITLQSDR